MSDEALFKRAAEVVLVRIVRAEMIPHKFARAEAVRDLSQMWADIYRYQTDNNIDELMSKSYASPKEMTDEEIHRLDGFYWQVMNAEWAQDMMAEEGLIPGDQEAFAELIANDYFSSPFGRAWFRLNEEECKVHAQVLCEVIGKTIDQTPVQGNYDYVDQLKSLL